MFDDMSSDDMMQFDLPKNQSSVIKVLGVGGGGSNAVNHMYQQGIRGVDFVICNTDRQALENSPIPNKIQLGSSLTEGLGAGARPEIGRDAALESVTEISQLLDTNTKMLFITAGMGGGTGTGAAPIISKTAKELDILVVAIVTIPFEFEGKQRMEQAQKGIEDLRPYVDSLIVINNNKLRQIYGNLGYKSGFNKADEVLASAAKGIAEVITHHYTLNIDLRDAKTVLSNSGTAIMGKAIARGESRAHQAIAEAIDSPLLNDNKITGCKNVLLLLVSGTEEITIDEIGEINDYIQHEAGGNANIIMGIGEDPELGDAVSVTVIATGFSRDYQVHDIEVLPKRVVHVLDGEQAPSLEFPTHSNRTEEDARLEFEAESDAFDRPIDAIRQEPTATHTKIEPVELPLPGNKVDAQEPNDSDSSGEDAANSANANPSLTEEVSTSDALNPRASETPDHTPEATGLSALDFSLEDEQVADNLAFDASAELGAPVVSDSIASPDFADNSNTPDLNLSGEDGVDINTDGITALGENEVLDANESPISDEENNAREQDFIKLEINGAHSAADTEEDSPDDSSPEAKPSYTIFHLEEEESDTAAEAALENEDTSDSAAEPAAEAAEDEMFTLFTRSESEPVAISSNGASSSPEKPLNTSGDEVQPSGQPERNASEGSLSHTLYERKRKQAEERKMRLTQYQHKFRNNPAAVDSMHDVPAYRRLGVELDQTPASSEEPKTHFTLFDDEEGAQLKTKNKFLHDNVD